MQLFNLIKGSSHLPTVVHFLLNKSNRCRDGCGSLFGLIFIGLLGLVAPFLLLVSGLYLLGGLLLGGNFLDHGGLNLLEDNFLLLLSSLSEITLFGGCFLSWN